ncbi:MAG: squalene synthase HpnC [Hyphomicrobiales bacterium]|nr:squalene synthase HpnC [Hyphomicrobiales bacterium]
MSFPQSNTVETPSGKDAAYENFPVGSWLLPRGLRPVVAVFYQYARAIDDIADNPSLPPEEKVRRLDGFARVIQGAEDVGPGYEKAQAMRDVLLRTGINPQHCLDLVSAFKQDAVKLRYRDWPDLIDYCDRSAAPVGRFLLDLHGGSRSGYAESDALCNALQVINHLQDCQDDYRMLDRVYLPLDWMEMEDAVVEDLDAGRSTPALRRVIDRTLDATETLMVMARRLPRDLHSYRLSLEASAIVDIADRLIDRLRRRDPLAQRVELTKAEFAWSCFRGVATALV